LHHFFYHAFYLNKKKTELYADALTLGYGEHGKRHYEQVARQNLPPDDKQFPMSDTINKLSKAVIFHNHWAANQIKAKNNVFVIPLAFFD
jgi:hypothetical protein